MIDCMYSYLHLLNIIIIIIYLMSKEVLIFIVNI